MKTFLNILLVLFFIQSGTAQFPDDISYQSIPTPNNVQFPNIRESITDNSVPQPIQITRITERVEYVDGNGDPQVWYPTHEYAKTQVWNADQSLFRIRSVKILDAITYEEVQRLSGDIYPSYWSNINPDLIWSFKRNGDVKKYSVSNDATETVASIVGYEFVQLGPGEGNMDKNDHYIALVGKKSNGDLDVIIFDLQTEQVILTKTFAGAWDDVGLDFPKYIDWVSISQSGDYVVIMWNHNVTSQDNPYNGHFGVEVYNRSDMQYQNRIVSYGNHGDLGYSIDGDEVLVQFYGRNGTLSMHRLDGSGSTVLNTHADFGKAGHVSCRNLNRPGWAYISHSLPAQSGQLVAVKLDDSGLVEHFGHHFSSATSYEQSAMPVASPNGDKICFKSDYGTGPNTNPSIAYINVANLDRTISVVNEELFNITIYPNPANDFIEIECENTIENITIYNATGQIVKTLQVNNLTNTRVSIIDLKRGFYVIGVSAEKKLMLKKILIE